MRLYICPMLILSGAYNLQQMIDKSLAKIIFIFFKMEVLLLSTPHHSAYLILYGYSDVLTNNQSLWCSPAVLERNRQPHLLSEYKNQ